MDDYLATVFDYLSNWGFVFVFFVLFLECVPLVGFAVPGLTVLLFSGFIASQIGLGSAAEYFFAALGGILLADNIAFWFGKKVGAKSNWVQALLSENRSRVDFLRSQSDWILILYQFPPYLRMIGPLFMGVLAFSNVRWLRIVTVSSVLFVATFFGIGYLFGALQQQVAASVDVAKQTSLVLALLLTIWIGALILRLIRMRH